ncbi:MAG TPA: hypothetical protein VOA78_04670 [Candidatus Dormibacteraeota bacterium]|nr:hypothetical protein [Candidatus Dormibacteraeota bacterium]
MNKRAAFAMLVLLASSVLFSQPGVSALSGERSGVRSRERVAAVAPAADAAVLVGAGDIADCKDLSGAEATAKLLEQIPGTVMAVGDLAYPDGTQENFACYDKTWGRVKSRTRPAPGNHEFHSTGAAYYFNYFGAAVGDPKQGYYSYDLGTWHIVVLNSECEAIGGCDAGSQQEKWLRADLAAHPAACTLAYFISRCSVRAARTGTTSRSSRSGGRFTMPTPMWW